MNAEHISVRLAGIQERILHALQRSGRAQEDVTIVAATKTHSAETVRAVLAAGLEQIGESKVQEAQAKREEVGRGRWRLIGHLQSNKARRAAEVFDAIDSVDSLELAQALERHADEAGRRLEILMQVNTSGEASKFGVAPGERALRLAEAINGLPHLELQGLMTLGPIVEDPQKARPVFALLRDCRDQISQELGLSLPVLSMGMSHDFEVAVEEGATMVRLGTALLGPRQTWKAKRQLASGED